LKNREPFIPGYPPEKTGPLSRYLPQIDHEIVGTWLRKQSQEDKIINNAWVLDPFSMSTRLFFEAVQSGYNILGITPNPISRFVINQTLNKHDKSEYYAALAKLGATYIGNQRFEPYINSLYHTKCNQCSQTIIAKAFIWERDASSPVKKVYECKYCGEDGEYPTQLDDIKRAEYHSRSGLYKARMLERVASINDPYRKYIELAFSTYLPRSLYALFIIINQIEGFSDTTRTLLEALTLSACDKANTLWPYPASDFQPKQLTTPQRFYEFNLWIALEESIDQWTNTSKNFDYEITIAKWPEIPVKDSGVCLYEGRLGTLCKDPNIHLLKSLNISSVVTVIPRYNQAFWTFSTIWAGWLWGHLASAYYKPLLKRRRFDWNWHTNALRSVFKHFCEFLDPDRPVLALIEELEPSFLSAVLLSFALSNIHLLDVCIRADSQDAQIHWSNKFSLLKNDLHISNTNLSNINQIIASAINSHLFERSEPSRYIYLHASALIAIIEKNLVGKLANLPVAELMSEINKNIKEILLQSGNYICYRSSKYSLTTGYWWFSDPANKLSMPYTDLIERKCIEYMHRNNEFSFTELYSYLCDQFPGLLTPEAEIVQLFLESYGETVETSGISWKLKDQENPKYRNRDVKEINQQLAIIGERLGYVNEIKNIETIIWRDHKNDPIYVFHIRTTAVFSEILDNNQFIHSHSFIVIPGGRTNLILYKLEKNPYLEKKFQKGWRFIKFRHIRRLHNDIELNEGNFDNKVDLDPLIYRNPQMRLF